MRQPRTIRNYEKGRTYPKDRQVYKTLADILGVDADYLHNENDDFVAQAQEKYGSRGKKQAKELLTDIDGLFAGGDMADEDMDEFMRAVQESFWKAKEKNRKKFTRKDYRKVAISELVFPSSEIMLQNKAAKYLLPSLMM